MICNAITNGFAEVVQKAVGLIAVFNNSASQSGHVFLNVVPTIFFEFSWEVSGPAYQIHFPAVGLQIFYAVPD